MSTIKTTTLSTQGGSTVPMDTVVNGTAKAWVNFNGTGTVAIRRAFNVSTITDNGPGNFTVNFTTAMVDTNYSAVAMQSISASYSNSSMLDNYTTTSVRMIVYSASASSDPSIASVAIFS